MSLLAAVLSDLAPDDATLLVADGDGVVRAVAYGPRATPLACSERVVGMPAGDVVAPSEGGAAMAWDARPLRSSAGQVIGTLYTGKPPAPSRPRDTSAWRDAAAEAFLHAASSLVVLDAEHRVIAANETAQRYTIAIMGRPLAVGDDILVASAVGAQAAFLEGFESAKAGTAVRRERKLTYPSGERREFYVEYVPLREGDGEGASAKPPRVLFGAIDIARKVEVEDELRLYRSALAQSPVTFLVADARQPDLPIVYASENVERITGYPPSELLGRNARVLQGRFTGDAALDTVRDALATFEPCEVVLRNERKDGTMFWNRLTLSPVRDDAGEVTHVLGVQQDITKKLELESRISQSEALSESSRSVAVLVHDFNNLLGVIASQVSFVLESNGDRAEQVEALDGTLDAIDHAAALLRSILAGPERAKGLPRPILLGRTFASLEKTLARRVPSTVALRFEAPNADLAVFMDPGALDQILMNLVINACDAIEGAGTVSVRARVDPRASARVVVEVADDGVGMSEEVRARIFEPLFTTKERERGTGLGLASVAKLVAEAGGAVHCASEVGVGTTFRLTLPSPSSPD